MQFFNQVSEHEIWLAKVSDPNNEEVRKFGSVLNANSEGVGTRINTFIQTYGNLLTKTPFGQFIHLEQNNQMLKISLKQLKS